ncbi:hypothetical protein [Ileibacterium valens]|uniref:hypothetical protein n=1 Tax=Ileibacterium valens TaxID=1862668 RepID=UPI002732164C|nr:hypothetical protein [Ileibacterium valens]
MNKFKELEELQDQIIAIQDMDSLLANDLRKLNNHISSGDSLAHRAASIAIDRATCILSALESIEQRFKIAEEYLGERWK